MSFLSNFIVNNLVSIILTFLVIVVLSIAWSAYLQFQIAKLKQNQRVFFEGKNGKDLESVILKNNNEIKKLDNDIEDLYKISDKIHKIALRGIQKIGFVRFNPFKDTGGNQSFAIALLDANNNGIIISSLYARHETRIYSKPISAGVSKFQLSEEEKQAMKEAMEVK